MQTDLQKSKAKGDQKETQKEAPEMPHPVDLENQKSQWEKSKSFSYETMSLIKTNRNSTKMLPCGFLKNGNIRPLSNNSLLYKIKRFHESRGTRPKVVICITMFNEDLGEFKRTMEGVIQNYEAMSTDENIKIHRNDILVVAVCDGFDHVPESFLNFAAEKGFWDPKILIEKGYAERDSKGKLKMKDIANVMHPEVKDIPKNLLHMFMIKSSDFGVQNEYYGNRAINFAFCLKHKNDGKINSQKWFYQGICKFLNPEYAMTLDIGTVAFDGSICRLVKYLHFNPTCGGCVGEIEVDMDATSEKNKSSWLTYGLQLYQYYEYRLGYLPSKNAEAFFGYIRCLPGAYALFRWNAIKGDPLEQFLKLVTSESLPTCFEANEYLTEDRILCTWLYVKTNENWFTTQVPFAGCKTDVPEDLETLMAQRRRWSNGCITGETTILKNWPKIAGISPSGNTNQGFFHRIGASYNTTLTLYNTFSAICSLSLGGISQKYITLFLMRKAATFFACEQSYPGLYHSIMGTSQNFNMESILTLIIVIEYVLFIIFSLGAPIKTCANYYRVVIGCWGILGLTGLVGLATFMCTLASKNGMDLLTNTSSPTYIMVLSVIPTLFYLFQPFYGNPFQYLRNIVPMTLGLFVYLIFVSPLGLLQIYSLCNTHNVSWGNRPGSGAVEGAEQRKQRLDLENSYKAWRTNLLGFVFFINILMFYFMDLSLHQTLFAPETIATQDLSYVWKVNQIGASFVMANMTLLGFVYQNYYWMLTICCKSKYGTPALKKQKPNSEEYEAMLDCNSDDEIEKAEVNKKQAKAQKFEKDNAEEDTDEEPSFISDDREAYKFMQKFK